MAFAHMTLHPKETMSVKFYNKIMMGLKLLTFAILATLFSGCAAPDLKDPLAGLGPEGGTAVPTMNPDYKALTVGLIASENTKNTIDYLNRSNVSKYVEIDKRMGEFAGIFEKHFKGVVRIARIEDAVEARADFVAVMDLYAHYHSTIYQEQRIDAKILFLSPDRSQIDIITAAGTRKGSDIPPTGRGMRGFRSGTETIAQALGQAVLDARDRVEQGLFASQKLQDFARSAAAGKPGARTAVPTAPVAAAPAAPAPSGDRSDVDTPTYSSAEQVDKFAVVIGVEKYASLPPADFAERDAEAVRRHLIALGYAPRHIKFLRGQTATRSKIAAYVEDWLPRNVTAGSTVFFYYSGHGSPDAQTKNGYLVPADGDPEYLERTGYSLAELYKKLDALPAKRVIVALDSCFSGAGGRSVLAKGTRPLVTKIDMAPEAGSKVVTLAAANGDQISGTMNEQRHGVFTYYLLKGLNGAATKDGQVTVQSLFDYLKPKVEDAASLDNRSQVPQLMPSTLSGNIKLR